jgi:hypothetical protein
MPLKKDDIEEKLANKFHFRKIKGKGRNDHERWAFYFKEKKIATTGFSRGFKGGTDLDDGLLTVMAREVRVQTLHNFKGMISCTVTLEKYLNILREQKFIQD